MFVLGIDPGLSRCGYGLVGRGEADSALKARATPRPAGSAPSGHPGPDTRRQQPHARDRNPKAKLWDIASVTLPAVAVRVTFSGIVSVIL